MQATVYAALTNWPTIPNPGKPVGAKWKSRFIRKPNMKN